MPIGNFKDRISSSDMAKVNEKMNPPEYKPGYDSGSDSGGSFDDLFTGGDGDGGFDSLNDSGFDDIFGSDSNDDIFGTGSSGSSGNTGGGGVSFPVSNQSNDPFANTNTFGSNSGGLFGINQNPMGMNQQQQRAPTLGDKFGEYSSEAVQSIGKILIEMVKSVSTRNADDFGYLSRNCIICGGITSVVGIVSSIIGLASGVTFLGFSGIGSQLILAGAMTAGLGFIGIGSAAYIIASTNNDSSASIDNLDDATSYGDEDLSAEYEADIDSALEDLFGSDEDDSNGLFGDDSDFSSEPEPESEPEPVPDLSTVVVPKIDFNEQADKIEMAGVLTREKLFNTFKDFMVQNTPEFSYRHEIDKSSEDFLGIATICVKAIANIMNVELSEVTAELDKAYDTYFSYELMVTRVRKLNNTDQIASEIENYFRSNSSDSSVNATVTIEGDYYKIIVTKGASAVVTFGDVFKLDYCRDFFLNTKHKLPIITGIDELGNVILDDAKVFDTMLIAGKPRSGKSWYVFSLLMSLMMFNTPEDVQFVIVDPKKSNLFKTLALMPHVAGLHDDSNILNVLDDIIYNEAESRRKILADNKVDDIWAVREKGVKLPILYLVIDEYITVKNNLGENKKDLDAKIQTLISQLPSLGIRLIFVPHRATGVVDKTNRTMLQFTAAVKADIEDVKDTLGVKKWDRALTSPGDIAIKTSNLQQPIYVRGAALTTSDNGNAEMMRGVAKAFYKMGVEIPDMSNMTIAANRIEGKVQQELGLSDRYYRYETSNPKISLQDIDKSDNALDLTGDDLGYNIKDFMSDFDL